MPRKKRLQVTHRRLLTPEQRLRQRERERARYYKEGGQRERRAANRLAARLRRYEEEGQTHEEAIRAEQNRSAILAEKRKRCKATFDKMSPRERCIDRIRRSIAERIQRSLAHPDILNAKKLYEAEMKRQRRLKRRKKDGDDETVARDGDSNGHPRDDEDGNGPLNKSKKVPDRPCYVETMVERDLRIDLTREAMALELGTFAKFGYEGRGFKYNQNFELLFHIQNIHVLKQTFFRLDYYRSKYANMEDDADSDTQDLSSQRNSKTPTRALMGDSSDSESEEDDEDSSADEAEAKKRPDESVEDWALRVSDIFNAKIETKSSASGVQDGASATPEVPGPSKSLREDRPVVIPSNRPFRESLLSSISSPEHVERILLVEAELAERRAELTGETLLEQKERIESLITLEMERVASRNKRLPPPPRDKKARAEWFEKWRGLSLQDMDYEQTKEFKKRKYTRAKELAKEKILHKNMTEEVSW
jgi:hypothetical protein